MPDSQTGRDKLRRTGWASTGSDMLTSGWRILGQDQLLALGKAFWCCNTKETVRAGNSTGRFWEVLVWPYLRVLPLIFLSLKIKNLFSLSLVCSMMQISHQLPRSLALHLQRKQSSLKIFLWLAFLLVLEGVCEDALQLLSVCICLFSCSQTFSAAQNRNIRTHKDKKQAEPFWEMRACQKWWEPPACRETGAILWK